MRTIAAATLFCSLALAVPAMAQSQITTGVIQGAVTDATGRDACQASPSKPGNAETNLVAGRRRPTATAASSSCSCRRAPTR